MLEPTHGSGGGGDDYGEFTGLLEQAEQHAQAASTRAAPPTNVAANAVNQVCQFWPTLRTVLQIALKLPFLSSRVKKVIHDAIPVFDSICGNS